MSNTERKRWYDALSILHGEQNGAPLLDRSEEWCEAMLQAQMMLSTVDGYDYGAIPCQWCEGRGRTPMSQYTIECKHCDGTGRYREKARTGT